MTASEIPVHAGKLVCPDGHAVSLDNCRFCIHSRYFLINGKQERSPALAFCLRERVTAHPDISRASAVGCAAGTGCGFASIGNIIS
ncbi:MAG TPA: hypothetical protein O0X27_00405 [Methanocorpusculum sp.]|nr:hypothetical protein [Methanocorpusculum sp.]